MNIVSLFQVDEVFVELFWFNIKIFLNIKEKKNYQKCI